MKSLLTLRVSQMPHHIVHLNRTPQAWKAVFYFVLYTIRGKEKNKKFQKKSPQTSICAWEIVSPPEWNVPCWVNTQSVVSMALPSFHNNIVQLGMIRSMHVSSKHMGHLLQSVGIQQLIARSRNLTSFTCHSWSNLQMCVFPCPFWVKTQN